MPTATTEVWSRSAWEEIPNSVSLGYEYVLLLNPDTEVEREALPRILSYMDQASRRIGVVGPRMIRPDGSLDTGCKRREPTPWMSLAHMTGLRTGGFRDSPIWAGYSCGYVNDR